VWELFVPGLEEGEKYKFEIRTRNGSLRVKSDPYAHRYELRPHTASIVADLSKHRWEDEEWLRARATTGEALDRPLHIYEVHLASWRSYGSLFPNYRQIAPDLAAYCVEKGYTHVELLPIMEHPFDESWGYQVTGFFAPTSRYGSPEDFQWFVDHLHQQGIGVILDWVPAHFPTDDFALNRFDGTALYEHEDPRKGIHPHWHTAIFNYGRNEVLNFLIASALFWIETMHVDGLRVDAVASIVYLDYGREAHHWIPNPDGSNFNVEGIEFLKHLNGIIRQRCPGVLMIAEESSSFTGVTHPGGLNFHLKWNMGWMNDTLRYMSRDPLFRRFHQNELTFSLLYAFSERFALVLSHDEVVHMKRSLLSKMPGPDWQKFANLRLLYSYQMCFPGKKLSFMGGELATWEEWDCSRPLPWNLLDYPLHRGIYDLVADLNHFYLRHPALWAQDFHWEGYEWLDFSDAQNSVIAYLRKGKGETLAIIHHFTPEYRPRYQIPLRFPIGAPQELFNTDDQKYGGSGKTGLSVSVQDGLLTIDLPPLATVVLRV
jgi:1,4-alpha-glucan branching enzyme